MPTQDTTDKKKKKLLNKKIVFAKNTGSQKVTINQKNIMFPLLTYLLTCLKNVLVMGMVMCVGTQLR